MEIEERKALQQQPHVPFSLAQWMISRFRITLMKQMLLSVFRCRTQNGYLLGKRKHFKEESNTELENILSKIGRVREASIRYLAI